MLRPTNAILLTLTIGCCLGQAQTLRFETNVGNFDVLMFDEVAPQTVANFMSYVDSGRLDGTVVHRSVPDFVIQGGGYTDELELVETFPPISNEFGTSNTRGTIAMAKTSDPDSARNQWFINVVDNPFLDNPLNSGGFTVFGEVIGSGMEVVDQINQLPLDNRRPAPFGELPVATVGDNASFVIVNRIVAIPEPMGMTCLSMFGALLWFRRNDGNR